MDGPTHEPPSEAVLCREAILKFLTEVHPLLLHTGINLMEMMLEASPFCLDSLRKSWRHFSYELASWSQEGNDSNTKGTLLMRCCPSILTILKVWSLGIGVMNDWGQIGRHMVLVYLLFSLGACLFWQLFYIPLTRAFWHLFVLSGASQPLKKFHMSIFDPSCVLW